MKTKSNESTALRPAGDRVLNAPLVEMDLNTLIAQLKQEITWENADRNSITLFKSDNMTIVLIGMHARSELKTHSAKGHTSVQVLDGEIILTTEQQKVLMRKGQMICLMENIAHSVLANKESFFLLTMMLTA